MCIMKLSFMFTIVILHLYTHIIGHSVKCHNIPEILLFKYDVTRVRNKSQMQEYRDRFTVLDFIGLVEQHGYTAEEYQLMTRDGYILVLHRITGSPLNPKAKAPGKPVVFFQHGLLTSSDSFVLIGPGKDLAFLLADVGYDVWLGNARGNTYSRSHVFLSTKQKKFWEFSYHEIGIIDLSTSIDYILLSTGQRQLMFVGYSMGTTEGFALLSTQLRYNKKISLAVMLAPIVFWQSKLPIGLQMLVNNAETLEKFSYKNNYYEFGPQSATIGKLSNKYCSDRPWKSQSLVCSLFFKLIPIADLTRFNMSALPIILSHFPAGTSIQSILHLVQNMNSGRFQAYDYGQKINYEKYSNQTPPDYNLKLVTTRVAIFYGSKDYFFTPKDIELLRKSLPNIVLSKRIPHNKFNHLDILWAKDSKSLLYDDILKLIKQYT